MSSKPKTELKIYLKSYDIDYGGVVSNIVYIRWLEDLRLELLKTLLPLNKQLYDGIAPVILDTKISYKSPIRILDQPRGVMWIQDMTSVRWTVVAEFRVGERIASSAKQVGAFVNIATGKPVRIPKRLADRYRRG